MTNFLKKYAPSALLAMAFIACEPVGTDSIEPDPSLMTVDNTISNVDLGLTSLQYCGEPVTQTLWAGQTINSGTVTIYNDATTLFVKVNAIVGFQSEPENLKMWLGTDLLLLPMTPNGTPKNGQFPYKTTLSSGQTEYTFEVPLSDIATYDANECGKQSIFVVVHADILAPDGNGGSSAQTAYAGDQNGTTPRWWYYFTYTPQCCVDVPPPTVGTLNTAFGKFDKSGIYGTGYVFTTNKKSNPENYASLNLTQNRWGWAGQVKTDGTYTFEMWAGAGLNKTSNGTLVGSVTVSKSGSAVTVTYQTIGGFSMQELHVYAGDFKPTTLAPGQYGYIQYFGDEASEYVTSHTATFTVDDTNGDGVWIIAHAVAFGSF